MFLCRQQVATRPRSPTNWCPVVDNISDDPGKILTGIQILSRSHKCTANVRFIQIIQMSYYAGRALTLQENIMMLVIVISCVLSSYIILFVGKSAFLYDII